MSGCIFCKIIKGDIPSTKVYEDDECIAFLDINPVNKGHTLIVPKKHAEIVTDMSKSEFSKLMEKVHKIAKAIKKSVNPDGFNIYINNHPAAGQEVPHVHVHIIPRDEGDSKIKPWTHGKYEEKEMDRFQDMIKKGL